MTPCIRIEHGSVLIFDVRKSWHLPLSFFCSQFFMTILYQIEPCLPEAWRTNPCPQVFSGLFMKTMGTALHQVLGNQGK